MIHLYDIMELCKLKAIGCKLAPNDEAVWRSVMREYSITFVTPLHLVKELDPEEVLLAVYEHHLDSMNVNEEKDFDKILNNLHIIEDPEFDSNKEKEEEEFNRQAEKEEEERQKKKAARKAASQKNTLVKTETPKELPKSGSVNLAYLANNQDNEG